MTKRIKGVLRDFAGRRRPGRRSRNHFDVGIFPELIQKTANLGVRARQPLDDFLAANAVAALKEIESGRFGRERIGFLPQTGDINAHYL